MILTVLAWIMIGFAVIRFGISLINWAGQLYLSQPVTQMANEKVSILIPARNEAHNLPALLSELLKQDYDNLEILVYDDHSEDETGAVVSSFAEKDPRIRLIHAPDLIRGWTGKNFACHNLAGHANGAYLLFLDADVHVSPDLVSKSLNYVKRKGVLLLSIFPHQRIHSLGEWLTVPMMNWILLSLLPLPLVRKSSRPSLAAANGQFMLFESESYKKNVWHEQVRESLVEDIEIIRLMKKSGYKVSTLLGDEDVMCRMYSDLNEGINGFAKNVIEFFGGSILAAFVFIFFTMGSVVIIPLALGWKGLALYVLLVLGIRIFISLASRQKVWKNLLLHIFQLAVFLLMTFKGMRVVLTGTYQWKGRTIQND